MTNNNVSPEQIAKEVESLSQLNEPGLHTISPFSLEIPLATTDKEKFAEYVNSDKNKERHLTAQKVFNSVIEAMRGMITGKRRAAFISNYAPLVFRYFIGDWVNGVRELGVTDDAEIRELYSILVVTQLNTAIAGAYGDLYDAGGEVKHTIAYDNQNDEYVVYFDVIPKDHKFARVLISSACIPLSYFISSPDGNKPLEAGMFNVNAFSQKAYSRHAKTFYSTEG